MLRRVGADRIAETRTALPGAYRIYRRAGICACIPLLGSVLICLRMLGAMVFCLICVLPAKAVGLKNELIGGVDSPRLNSLIVLVPVNLINESRLVQSGGVTVPVVHASDNERHNRLTKFQVFDRQRLDVFGIDVQRRSFNLRLIGENSVGHLMGLHYSFAQFFLYPHGSNTDKQIAAIATLAEGSSIRPSSV